MTPIVMTGGRDYTSFATVCAVFDAMLESYPDMKLHHGAARGADTLAARWAERRGVPVEGHPVTPEQWRTLGKRAGHMRNGAMLTKARPVMVVAFPGGRGTANMCAQASERGIIVQRYG